MSKTKLKKVPARSERKIFPQGVVAVDQSQPIVSTRFDLLSRPTLFFVYLLLFSLIVGVFFPAIRNEFLFWFGDDPGYVTENKYVQTGLTLEGVKWAFSNIDLGNWHPLTFLSHILDGEIYGLKPWGHHLTSVLLHAANTLLLFIILRRMTGATWCGLVVALLFGLHPLRVESVAWVAERKDVLAAFFWNLTLLAYAHYAEIKTHRVKAKVFYSLALASFACGLMSKGMLVTLPFALLLLDYWPLRRFQDKRALKLVIEKLPFMLLAIATSIITIVAQKHWGFVQTIEKYSLIARLENAVVSYCRYIVNLFWPVNLSSYYPHPGHWPLWIVLICLFCVAGFSVLAVVRRHKSPWLAVGWFWYLGTLVPVIGLVQLGDAAMADRYSYIPIIGILISLVWEFHALTKQSRYEFVKWAITGGVFLVCIVITRQQIAYFKDSVTLWRHAFEASGDVDVAQHALALSLDKEGRTDEAISELQALLKAHPNRSDVHFNLATMFQEKGRLDEAITYYRNVLKLSSGSNEARYNLGLCLFQQGESDEAMAQFQEMIRMNRDPKAYNALGTVQASAGNVDEAIENFKSALAGRRDYVDAHNNLGIALAEKGMIEEAIGHFEEAIRIDAGSVLAKTFLESLKQTGKLPVQ